MALVPYLISLLWLCEDSRDEFNNDMQYVIILAVIYRWMSRFGFFVSMLYISRVNDKNKRKILINLLCDIVIMSQSVFITAKI